MLHLSTNIKLIRAKSKKTQKDFAAMLGASEAMQKSYESGRAAPDILYLQLLASFSNVSVEDLTGKELNHSAINIKRSEGEKDEKVNIDNAKDEIINKLVDLTRQQSTINDKHADARIKEADNNSRLIALLEGKYSPTADASLNTHPESSYRISQLIRLVAEIGAGLRYKDLEAALDDIHTRLNESGQIVEVVGTSDGDDKNGKH